MRVQCWGVRGMIAVAGAAYNRYGGNTPCISLESEGGDLLILSMGTGLFHLGNHLMTREFRDGRGHATILMANAMWDHTQGLGFFAPVFVPGNQFTLWGNAATADALERIMEGGMNPNVSPIQTLRNLGAAFTIKATPVGASFEIGDFTVSAIVNPHGNVTSLAFRIVERATGKVLVFAPDVGYADAGAPAETIAFYRGADVLIHDTTFSVADDLENYALGYSSVREAAQAAAAAAVKTLVMFHYGPDYTDDDIDALFAACRAELDAAGGTAIALLAARDGSVFTL